MFKLLQYIKSCLLTFLFFTRTFLVDCRCGVGTFLSRKVHNDAEPIFLDLGYWNIFKLKIILFCRYLSKDASLFQDGYQSTCDNIVTQLENQTISKDRLSLEVDTYQVGDISPEKFFQEYLLKGKPVVIQRGSLDGENLFSEQYFLEHYGDTNIAVDDMETGKRSQRSLKNYLSNDDPDSPAETLCERIEYVRNSYNFILENPDFIESLNPQQFDAYMSGTEAKNSCYVGSELFLGKSKKTGTSFHCANGNNLFFMVSGKKKWTFVHPDYTWLMYPILNDPMRYIISDIIPQVTSLAEAIDKIYPLWNYCPKYTVVLNPGDVLLSPSWYWHTVENLTDMTIGVATRWLPINKPTNRFLTLLQVFSKPTWKLIFDLLQGDSSMNDESVLIAEESLDEKLAFGKTGQAQKMWEDRKQKAKQLLSPETYRQYCLNLDPQYSENV